MGKVIKPKKDLNIVHCEKIILEGGNIIYRFYADKTCRNFLERIAWENY